MVELVVSSTSSATCATDVMTYVAGVAVVNVVEVVFDEKLILVEAECYTCLALIANLSVSFIEQSFSENGS